MALYLRHNKVILSTIKDKAAWALLTCNHYMINTKKIFPFQNIKLYIYTHTQLKPHGKIN